MMRRPLRWLTSQMREFQLAAARQIDAQADALENLNRLEVANRLSELERGLEGVRQEALRFEGTGDRLNWLSEMAPIHDSAIDVFRLIVPELREKLHDAREGIEAAQREIARLSRDFGKLEALRSEVSTLREQSKRHGGWQEPVAEIRRDVDIANRTLPEIGEIRSGLREQLRRTEGGNRRSRKFAPKPNKPPRRLGRWKCLAGSSPRCAKRWKVFRILS